MAVVVVAGRIIPSLLGLLFSLVRHKCCSISLCLPTGNWRCCCCFAKLRLEQPTTMLAASESGVLGSDTAARTLTCINSRHTQTDRHTHTHTEPNTYAKHQHNLHSTSYKNTFTQTQPYIQHSAKLTQTAAVSEQPTSITLSFAKRRRTYST